MQYRCTYQSTTNLCEIDLTFCIQKRRERRLNISLHIQQHFKSKFYYYTFYICIHLRRFPRQEVSFLYEIVLKNDYFEYIRC